MKSLMEFFLPSYCLLCHLPAHGMRLCEGCTAHINELAIGEQSCQCCRLPLLSDAPLCGKCLSHRPDFDSSSIPFVYEQPLDYLVLRFKYKNCQASGQALAHLLASYLQQHYTEPDSPIRPDIIVSTPLHWRRHFSRGFNQTSVLARVLSKQLNIPFMDNVLIRTRHTDNQKGLNRKQRSVNIRGAFSLSEHLKGTVKNKVVAVLDDVVTTTTTARELSRVLRKAGASEIQVWALARTPHH